MEDKKCPLCREDVENVGRHLWYEHPWNEIFTSEKGDDFWRCGVCGLIENWKGEVPEGEWPDHFNTHTEKEWALFLLGRGW